MNDDCETTTEYWDCDCASDYLHKSSEETHCLICDSYRDECPDSRVNEIKQVQS